MADSTFPLPLSCPHCHHGQATLTIFSTTILTVTCVKCGHSWSTEVARVPNDVRKAAQVAVLMRHSP